jgi:outer membrane protein OmpA-like peptidoglycan-associated protein
MQEGIMKRVLVWSAAALLGVASSAALAQSGPVLRGKDLNETALIRALTPEPREIRLRSLKVEPTRPPKPAEASLLITFETNSADLTAQARDSLDVVGRALNANELVELRFEIEGHADPRGGHDLNQRLSEARAQSVRLYLVQAHNISSARLRAVGKGDRELMNTGNPVAPENRRVTIKTVVE